MTLEQIFYLSQSVASVAVVGSLIYLGLQVRSAERSQRRSCNKGGRTALLMRRWLLQARNCKPASTVEQGPACNIDHGSVQ